LLLHPHLIISERVEQAGPQIDASGVRTGDQGVMALEQLAVADHLSGVRAGKYTDCRAWQAVLERLYRGRHRFSEYLIG